MPNEMFLIKIKYFLSDEANQFLVNGTKELAKLVNLLSRTNRYSILSIEKLGRIDDYSDLVQDLIDDQKPTDLDCSVKFTDGKENNNGDQE
jgi:hypothetical protein